MRTLYCSRKFVVVLRKLQALSKMIGMLGQAQHSVLSIESILQRQNGEGLFFSSENFEWNKLVDAKGLLDIRGEMDTRG